MAEDGAPVSQAARIAAVLKEKILSSELAPGSSHLESELADMLGVSRTPVREAAVILEGHGLVEIRPRRGIRVLPLTVRDMEEIYDILTELEPLAAQRATERGQTDESLAPLEACLARMEQALAEEDRRAWAEADDRFHEGLVALSGNRRLMSVVRMYSDQVHRARLITLNMRPSPQASNDDHRRLLTAIREGRAEDARAIHREHRQRAKVLLTGLLEKLGLARF